MEKYKFYIVIEFRNGKKLNLFTNNTYIKKDPHGYSQLIYIDDEPILQLVDRGAGEPFTEGIVTHYTGFPRKKLFDYFPEDWDREEKGFGLIDKVIVDSHGRKV